MSVSVLDPVLTDVALKLMKCFMLPDKNFTFLRNVLIRKIPDFPHQQMHLNIIFYLFILSGGIKHFIKFKLQLPGLHHEEKHVFLPKDTPKSKKKNNKQKQNPMQGSLAYHFVND